MIRKIIGIIGISILLGSIFGHAQDASRWGFNVGGGFGVPLASTSNFVNTGGNFVVGGGHKFSEMIMVNGEFMWQGLPLKADNLLQIGALGGGSNLYSFTGNLMLKTPRANKFGGYAIGGGGWYRRTDTLSRQAVVPGTVCLPAWDWWVPACLTGLVPADQVLASRTDNVFGANVGGGFTYKVTEAGMKVYVEARFHYAPTKNVYTRVIPVTFGVRW
jgi:hypothetical protein